MSDFMTMPDVEDTPADEPKKDDAPVDPVKVAADAVEKTTSSFREMLEEMRRVKAPAAAGPSPEEIAASQAATQQKLIEEYKNTTSRYDELCAEGKYSEAAELLTGFQRKVAQSTGGRAEDTPAYKAMYSTARRTARSEHGELFEEYAEEIEAEVARQDPGDRINPDIWDEAVARVKAAHIDDILEKRLAERETAAAAAPASRIVKPNAPQHRAASPNAADGSGAIELDEQQQWAAEFLGLTPEEYKKSLKQYEKAQIRRGFHRGMANVLPAQPIPGGF